MWCRSSAVEASCGTELGAWARTRRNGNLGALVMRRVVDKFVSLEARKALPAFSIFSLAKGECHLILGPL
jgi:hypothetical protein